MALIYNRLKEQKVKEQIEGKHTQTGHFRKDSQNDITILMLKRKNIHSFNNDLMIIINVPITH